MKWLFILLASLITSMTFGQTRVEIIKEYDEQGNLTRVDSVVTENNSSHGDSSMDLDELMKQFENDFQMDSLFTMDDFKNLEELKFDFNGIEEEIKHLLENDELKDMMQSLMQNSEQLMEQLKQGLDGLELDKLPEDGEILMEENSNKKTKSDKKKKDGVEYY